MEVSTDMDQVKMYTDDEVNTHLHKLIEIIVAILIHLKSDQQSILILSEDASIDDLSARYFLHSIKAMIGKLRKFNQVLKKSIGLIKYSNYSSIIKIKWLKCLSLYQKFFNNLEQYEIASSEKEYILSAERTLEVIDSLEVLINNFSESVKEVTLIQPDFEDIQNMLQTLDEYYFNSRNIIKRYGFLKSITNE